MRLDRVFGPALLIALSGPIIFYGLGSYSLVNGDEGIYHYMARHMVETGDWSRLVFTREERLIDTLTHAPLFLWAKALVIVAIGDGYWSMRILTASLGLLSVLATYGFVAYLENRRAALFAGLIQLLTFQFVYLHAARTGEMETSLTLAFTLAAWLYVRALSTGGSFVAHHLCLIALMALKLPIVAVPVAAEAVYFALRPRARARLWDWIATAMWMIPLGLSWHAYQLLEHWDALGPVVRSLQKLSVGTPSGSGTGSTRKLELTAQTWYYARYLLWGAFPFTLLYPVALAGVLLGTPAGPARRAWLLPALYVAASCAFFLSLTIHQPWYLMPAIPFLSAFAGAGFARLLDDASGLVARVAVAAALGATAWIELPIVDYNPFEERAVATPVHFGWAHWLGLAPWLGAGTLALAAWIALELAARRGRIALVAVPIGAALLLVAGVRVLAPLQFVDHESAMERLARRLDDDLIAGRRIEYPVIVSEAGRYKARFFFGDQYDIRRLPKVRRRRGEVYALYPLLPQRGVRPDGQPLVGGRKRRAAAP